ncbi:MAG: sigma-70 region 4 domain-containing protein [Sphingorhabdus sp.]
MSINMGFSSQYAEANSEFSYPYDDTGGYTLEATGLDPQPSVDVSAATRKVWHDYLAQYDVPSAIMTVAFPSPDPQRQAFLIGLDHARDNPDDVQRLLGMAEKIWSRVGQQPACQFQVSATKSDSESEVDGGERDLFANFDFCVAAQKQHNGALIRAIYFRQKGAGRFNRQEVGSLQQILPLFADSAAGGAHLARQSQRSAMLEAMFDRVSISMTMLSADSQPLFMNSAAIAMLDERKWLIRSADGSICGTNPKQAKAMRDSIRLAATAADDAPCEDVFRLDSGTGEWRLAYVVSAHSRAANVTTRCAMLIVLAPGKMEAPTHLLEALGLLPSEQRFLGHFLKSSSLGSAAEDCGLSEETARTYLKRVRAKLGVHRQMELAGLISGLVLPLNVSGHHSIGE